MIGRFTEDQYNTILAIKQDNFDEFWKKRCNIDYILSPSEKYQVISQLALEVFEKRDWYLFQKATIDSLNIKIVGRTYQTKKSKTISLKQITQCYLTTIALMNMVD